ncbi:metal ABC transporter permease [Candidatus Aerophobetes bacterium]|uniref:Metal ABC transporter permease n=1 Tax=Aerophobetes bacterium TaxID=2030807 RepID=A0A2A4WZ91_UNCAE|nr:MAG: metal ABC transporter permease [Candidatus Aerophobetes bacterium]
MTFSFYAPFFSNPLLFMALLSLIGASFSSGIIGSFVVVKRMVFVTGSIAHSILGGMGLFLFLSRTFNLPFLTPLYGALFSGIVTALIISWATTKYKERLDTVIGSIWALGMSAGIIFVSITPGYTTELLHFLFGDILWTTKQDILTLLSLGAIIILTTYIFYHKFMVIIFDEELAKLQGLNVRLLNTLLMILIALTIVILVKIVGAVLLIALLSLPAAIASTYTNKLSTMMALTIGLNMLIGVVGLYLSYVFNFPPGATITLIAAIAYFSHLVMRKQKQKI